MEMEISKDVDCAWVLIYDRLSALGQPDKMTEYIPAKNGTVRRAPETGKEELTERDKPKTEIRQ